jgi:hypothetical protein
VSMRGRRYSARSDCDCDVAAAVEVEGGGAMPIMGMTAARCARNKLYYIVPVLGFEFGQ